MTQVTHARRPRLDTVRRRLDHWRGERSHPRAPLPPRLWAAAVALVPTHGLYRTARALQLDYGALKRQVDRQAGASTPRPRFIELPAALPVVDDAVIEVAGLDGRTVRVRLHGQPLPDVADFTRRLLGTTS